MAEDKVVYNKDGTKRKKMGRPKGKKDSYKRTNLRGAPAQKACTWQPTTPEEIAKSDKHLALSQKLMAYSFSKPKVNFHTDHEEMQTRFVEYLGMCREFECRPNLVGTAITFGIDLPTLSHLHARQTKATPEVYETVDRIYAQMNNYVESMFASGDIPTVNGIFLLKNHHGYKDQQEVVVASQNPLGEDVSEKALADKYAKSVPQLEPMEATEFEVVKE